MLIDDMSSGGLVTHTAFYDDPWLAMILSGFRLLHVVLVQFSIVTFLSDPVVYPHWPHGLDTTSSEDL